MLAAIMTKFWFNLKWCQWSLGYQENRRLQHPKQEENRLKCPVRSHISVVRDSKSYYISGLTLRWQCLQMVSWQPYQPHSFHRGFRAFMQCHVIVELPAINRLYRTNASFNHPYLILSNDLGLKIIFLSDSELILLMNEYNHIYYKLGWDASMMGVPTNFFSYSIGMKLFSNFYISI